MVRSLLLLIGLFLTSVVTAGAPSSQTILVESEAWEGATESDGTGLYWDILRAVFEIDGMTISPNTSTYKRSVGLLKNGKIDIMVGAYDGEINGVVYPRWHFDADRVAVVTAKRHSQDWHGMQTLDNKHVAYIKGYAFRDYIDVDFKKHEYYQRERVFELLQSGKIDYYIDAEAEIRSELAKGYLNATEYEVFPLKNLELFFVFADNTQGIHLRDMFDSRFETLLASGEIHRLYEKWGWEPFAFDQAELSQ